VIRLIVLLALACATAVTPTAATARVRHNVPHTAYWRAPTYDPNAVFVGGTRARIGSRSQHPLGTRARIRQTVKRNGKWASFDSH
jgi:hypothetical protein